MIKSIQRSKDNLDSLIDHTHDAVVNATDRAERGVEAAAKRVVKGSHVASQSVREGAKATSREAHRRLADGAQAVDRGYLRARSELARAGSATSEFVVEHPGTTILAAASAGFLVGLLLPRLFRAK